MSRDYNILRDIIGMNRDIRVGKVFCYYFDLEERIFLC